MRLTLSRRRSRRKRSCLHSPRRLPTAHLPSRKIRRSDPETHTRRARTTPDRFGQARRREPNEIAVKATNVRRRFLTRKGLKAAISTPSAWRVWTLGRERRQKRSCSIASSPNRGRLASWLQEVAGSSAAPPITPPTTTPRQPRRILLPSALRRAASRVYFRAPQAKSYSARTHLRAEGSGRHAARTGALRSCAHPSWKAA